MTALRKASAYSKRHAMPFTRISKQKKKAFIKMVPAQKIVRFTMGNEEFFKKGKFPHHLSLISDENIQIRHNALEACRQYINKKLEEDFPGQYFFKVVPFPHHIQRENKMLTGAGSDRMQTGMQLSFGKSIGKAALVKKGGEIFFVALPNTKAVQYTRKLLKQISPKLPCKTKMLYAEVKA